LGEKSEIAPAIEVDLDGEPRDRATRVERAQLRVVGIATPDHAIEEFRIGGAETDEIVAAAMIRAKDNVVIVEAMESFDDVGVAKVGAVVADDRDTFVTRRHERADGVAKSRFEIATDLPMGGQARTAVGRAAIKGEEMDGPLRRDRPAFDDGSEKWCQACRQSARRTLGDRRACEHQQGVARRFYDWSGSGGKGSRGHLQIGRLGRRFIPRQNFFTPRTTAY